MSTDLLAMQTQDGSGQGTVKLELFGAPALTSGIQVVAQRFLTLLLRDYDEKTGLGTTFIIELTRSRVINDPFLIALVGQSVLQVQDQMPTVGAPDELLRLVRILAARKTGDGVFVRFELTSQADTTITFELPRILA